MQSEASVEDAQIAISYTGSGKYSEQVTTDADGQTELLELAAPPLSTVWSRRHHSPTRNILYRLLRRI